VRKFGYYVLVEDGADEDGFVTITEDEILADYWSYWHNKMVRKFGPGDDLITTENCIKDWCVVHYAREITE
jgi:hypothetical protein